MTFFWDSVMVSFRSFNCVVRYIRFSFLPVLPLFYCSSPQVQLCPYPHSKSKLKSHTPYSSVLIRTIEQARYSWLWRSLLKPHHATLLRSTYNELIPCVSLSLIHEPLSSPRAHIRSEPSVWQRCLDCIEKFSSLLCLQTPEDDQSPLGCTMNAYSQADGRC